jgi:GDP-L-fucose synthase
LHVDDLADACILLLKSYDKKEVINIGSGEDIQIKDLAELIRSIAQYEGELIYDISKQDGTPRKLMDISKIKDLGWVQKIRLEDGIKNTFLEFKFFYESRTHINYE